MFLYQCWNHKCLTLILNSYFISHHISWNPCPPPQLPHLSQLNLCDFSEPVTINQNIFFFPQRHRPLTCVSAQSLQSCPTLCDLMDLAHQDPLSMGFSRKEYWSGLPYPLPGNLPHPVIKLKFLMSLALAGRCFTISTAWEDPPSSY